MTKKIVRQSKLYDYEGFVDKFKPKKTTDDCYTPKAVYDCILNHVHENVMSLDGYEVVRPFYPGGDYESFEYKDNTVVIDNPPFSILAKIVDFYILNDIKFFLFAPHLTLLNYASRRSVCCIVCGVTVEYENGAKVNTSFLTNMLPEYRVIVDGNLFRGLMESQVAVKKHKINRKIIYPSNICTAANLATYIAVRGGNMKIKKESCCFVGTLDCGYHIFGGGLLVSDSIAAEKAAAEKAATHRLTMSSDELQIIRNLK